MQAHLQVLFLIGITACLGVVAGCSKPVAPIRGSANGVARNAASGAPAMDHGSGARSFRVRLHFVGPVVTLDRAFEPRLDRRADFYVYSSGEPAAAVDTVPAYSVLTQVRWKHVARGDDDASNPGAGDSFDEVPVGPGRASRESTRVFAPGLQFLTLRAPERAGGGSVTVAFFVAFPPGAWWAGPDPELFPRSSDSDGRAVDVTDWRRFTTTPAWPPDGRGYFGPDSFHFVPSQRRPVRGDFERRTFYEIYGDRIYARSEGDTVHANAWVAFCHGGYDRDSRYAPTVDPADPALPAGFAGMPDRYRALIPQGLLGAPSGFRSVVITKLADGTLVRPSQTTTYPNFDPNSVFRNPQLLGYWPTRFPGKAYAVARAVDAQGLGASFSFDPVALADRVDAGGGTPSERLERREILTFYVRTASPQGPSRAGSADTRGHHGMGRGN